MNRKEFLENFDNYKLKKFEQLKLRKNTEYSYKAAMLIKSCTRISNFIGDLENVKGVFKYSIDFDYDVFRIHFARPINLKINGFIFFSIRDLEIDFYLNTKPRGDYELDVNYILFNEKCNFIDNIYDEIIIL